MKAISADPKSVQDLFRAKQYVIPPFQRPYTWDETTCSKIDIEHVCPKNWSNVDGWTQEEHMRLVNTIGNLIPLEKSINIQVSNFCFEKKRTGMSLRGRGTVPYSKSLSPEAQELAGMTTKRDWLPADVMARTERKINALKDFLLP